MNILSVIGKRLVKRIAGGIASKIYKPPKQKRSLQVRGWVILRHPEPIQWTNIERDHLRSFLRSDTWRKLQAIFEQEIVDNMLPESNQLVDQAFVQAFISGKCQWLPFLYEHTGWEPKPMGEQIGPRPLTEDEEKDEERERELAAEDSPIDRTEQ